MSSAYQLAAEIVNERYDPSQWNIYPFHFSDGDNWDGGDTAECINILENDLLPRANLFCYGQVKSAYGSGDFLYGLQEYFTSESKLLTSKINGKEEIYESIRVFLSKGR